MTQPTRTVRRVAGSRTAKAASLRLLKGAVVVAIACTVAGCGPEPEAREPMRRGEHAEGYAYTGVLATRHPLWDALRNLEVAVEELARSEWAPAVEAFDYRFETITFIDTFALQDPEPRLETLRAGWRADYPPLVIDRAGLSADLQARVAWERERAGERVADRLVRARSAESRRLAQLRIRLVEHYQERLMNLAIDTEMRDAATAEAARREQERIWHVIEAEIEAGRQAGAEQLAVLEAQLRQSAVERVAEAVQRTERVRERREATMEAAGEALYGRMVEEMRQPWPRPDADEVSVSAPADAANELMREAAATRGMALAARDEKAIEQRDRLLSALAQVQSQIREETESAAAVVAYRDSIDLQLLPGDRRRGREMTGSIAQKLSEFWGHGGQQGS